MKVFLDMVGCRLNQSEIESYARQFRLAGHTMVPDCSQADLVVINTCTVTAAAASDSRQKIRQASRANSSQVIVTGCLATLNPEQIASIPGVTQLIDNAHKDDLVATVLNLPRQSFEHRAIPREPIPGTRLRTRAFIKVQDGCDNYCTYCITRLARGASSSRLVDDILLDIHSALEGGSQEIILTGVHLGSWGYDFARPSHLHDLVKAILAETRTLRLRLSSIEPWDITPAFLDLWPDSRLCRHLHLSLQSGCTSTLKRMGRKITTRAYSDLLHQARLAIPGVAITTDIITGFPGETEAEFAESVEFVRVMGFAGGHVFTFSPRPGTAAVNLPDQVSYSVAKQRNAVMRQVFQHSALEYKTGQINQVLPVLWEKSDPTDDHAYQLSGLTDNYLRVHAISDTPCHNQIMNVRITSLDLNGVTGDILVV